MPFLSKKQNAWAHTANGTKALGGSEKVKEWESSTNYSKLPERSSERKRSMLGGAVRRKNG